MDKINTVLNLIACRWLPNNNQSIHIRAHHQTHDDPPSPPGSDRTFRVRLAALVDLYGALSRTSKSLQSLQLLPWERQARFAGLVVKLQLMTDSLPRTPAPRTSRASLDASDIRRELQRRDDPEEMREQWPTLARYRENLTAEQVRAAGSTCVTNDRSEI